jgi:hypothetical protein
LNYTSTCFPFETRMVARNRILRSRGFIRFRDRNLWRTQKLSMRDLMLARAAWRCGYGRSRSVPTGRTSSCCPSICLASSMVAKKGNSGTTRCSIKNTGTRRGEAWSQLSNAHSVANWRTRASFASVAPEEPTFTRLRVRSSACGSTISVTPL